MPTDVPNFRTPDDPVSGSQKSERMLWRFRVREIIDDAPAPHKLVRARTYARTLEGSKDYVIQVQSDLGVGDPFYATRPEGGTEVEYGDPLKRVVWMESPGGGTSLKYGVVQAEYDPATLPYVEVRKSSQAGVLTDDETVYKLLTSGVVVGALKHNWLQTIVRTDDIVAYLPFTDVGDVSIIGVMVSPPIRADNEIPTHAMLQIIGPGVCGWDFFRTHPEPPTPP